MKLFARIWLVGCMLAAASNQAGAWSYEEFRSGMSKAQVALAMHQRRHNDMVAIPISNRANSYVYQCRSQSNRLHFTFCNERLSEISIAIDGSVHTFAQLVSVEARQRGLAELETAHASGKSVYWARWTSAKERYEVVMDVELRGNRVGIAKQLVDVALDKLCS